jgi:hypothetical protein
MGAVITNNANVNSVAAEAVSFFEVVILFSFLFLRVVPQKSAQRAIRAEFHDLACRG